jgi:hypothetical protein
MRTLANWWPEVVIFGLMVLVGVLVARDRAARTAPCVAPAVHTAWPPIGGRI